MLIRHWYIGLMTGALHYMHTTLQRSLLIQAASYNFTTARPISMKSGVLLLARRSLSEYLSRALM